MVPASIKPSPLGFSPKSNIRFEQTYPLERFRSSGVSRGFIENVRVRRIQVGISKAAVIRFETNYHSYRGGKSPTTYRDFVIEDVNAADASAYMLFADGLDELPIRDVLLRNVIVAHAREPLFLRTTLPEHPPMTPPDAPRLKISL